jgi:hypothetical protein
MRAFGIAPARRSGDASQVEPGKEENGARKEDGAGKDDVERGKEEGGKGPPP